MSIIGYFSSAAEMNKLVQSKLLPGVVEEIYEVGQLIPKLGLTTVDCYELEWNRESVLPGITPKARGEQYAWREVAEHNKITLGLEEYGDQWALPKRASKTYKDPNDYIGVMKSQIVKGALRSIEDDLIYGDKTTYSKQFDGIDKLCPAVAGHAFGANQDYDMGGGTIGLSIVALLGLLRACKPKADLVIMPGTICDQLFIHAMGKAGAIIMARSPNEFGMQIPSVNGVPIVESDYLLNENDNTGGKDAGNDSGLVSIYAIRFGSVEDGGLSLGVGGDTGGTDFFEMDDFDKLEGYNATGVRAYCYVAPAMGSTKCVSRVHSICAATAIDATS